MKDIVQAQLAERGMVGYVVKHCAVKKRDIRPFFMRRLAQASSREPGWPIARMLNPAVQRLSTISDSETIYRWEADAPVGRIVGYSTEHEFIAVYPWVISDGEWVASVVHY